jgi:O-antigen/teichoic acid export membrane protein
VTAAAEADETARGGALSDARRAALVVLAIRIAGAGLAYLTQVLMARLVGASEYGIFATMWVIVAMVGHGALLGTGQTVCRFVPIHRAQGRDDLARGFIQAGQIFAPLAAATIAGLGILATWLLPALLAPAWFWPVTLAALILPLFALQDFLEGIARAMNWPQVAIAPPYILRQGLIAAGMIAALVMGAPATAATAMAATLVATALAVLAQALWLGRRMAIALPPGPRAYDLRCWIAASLPVAFVDVTQIGLAFADVLILSLFASPAEVGVYFAATRLLQFISFVAYAGTAATAQRFADAHARQDMVLLDGLLRRTARWSALATTATAGAIVLAAPWLLALFGKDFTAGLPILAILATGLVAQSLGGPAEDVLTMLGEEKACARASFTCLCLAIALAFALAPSFGAIGVAGAMAAANAARGAALAAIAWQRLRLWTSPLPRPHVARRAA